MMVLNTNNNKMVSQLKKQGYELKDSENIFRRFQRNSIKTVEDIPCPCCGEKRLWVVPKTETKLQLQCENCDYTSTFNSCNASDLVHGFLQEEYQLDIISYSDAQKGLIVKYPWTELILNNEKTVEIRGVNSHYTGTFFIIQSGTNLILGESNLDYVEKIDKNRYVELKSEHKVDIPFENLPYKDVYAWHLSNTKRYAVAIPFNRSSKQGAIMWISNVKQIVL